MNWYEEINERWVGLNLWQPPGDEAAIGRLLDQLKAHFALERRAIGLPEPGLSLIINQQKREVIGPIGGRKQDCIPTEIWVSPGIETIIIEKLTAGFPDLIIDVMDVLTTPKAGIKVAVPPQPAPLLMLPPNQAITSRGKWPLVGEKGPRRDDSPWTVSVSGLVLQPFTLSLEQLRAMEQVEMVVNIHCVTRWSRPASRFRGVPLESLMELAQPHDPARYASFVARSERNHSTSLPLNDALALDTLIALEADGRPLEEKHGGPVRIVVPGRYFYKSLKWLERIEILAQDQLGYWEGVSGYHNEADPWREQRYIASNLDRKQVAHVLSSRNMAGMELLSIHAEGMDLARLNARGAELRNAFFRDADLRDAQFSGANLSNAHFEGADLRGADFQDADLEGADLRGSDLRGANLCGTSLFGTTIGPEGDDKPGANLDETTRFDNKAMLRLSLGQQEYVRIRTGKM